MYRMIVLDLDGTLTNSEKKISKRTFDALMAAQRSGCRVVLASGRPTYGVMPLAYELQLGQYGGYIMPLNGGIVIDCKSKKTVFEQKLEDEIVPLIYKRVIDAGLDILTYRGDAIVASNSENKYVGIEADINKMPVIGLKDFPSEIEYPVNKCLVVGDPEKIEVFEPQIAKDLEGRISVYTSTPFFLECMPPGIDKASSLDRLIKILKIDRQEVIACGDGHNDLSMIKFAGLGVAMNNADELVKAAADYITGSNDEDGVGQVIERFILAG